MLSFSLLFIYFYDRSLTPKSKKSKKKKEQKDGEEEKDEGKEDEGKDGLDKKEQETKCSFVLNGRCVGESIDGGMLFLLFNNYNLYIYREGIPNHIC